MATDEIVNGVFGDVIEQLRQQSRKSQYQTNPKLWAKDVLGVDLWSKQEDIFETMLNHDHAAVRSCHGSGKSFTASIVAAWWISVHPLGEAIVVTTAPTYAQVHAILWEDIRKHHITANQRFKEGISPLALPGYITQSDQWKSDDGLLLGFGRKPADNNDHGFQGIHRRYVLVIIDESCGIKENLFTAVEAITTTENSRILAIGNPDDPATHFNKFFTTDEVWGRMDVSAFDSPNFTRKHEGHYQGCDDPECLNRRWAERWDRDKHLANHEMLKVLPNEEWVEQRRKQWGEGSPLWLSKVLGQFPLQSVNTLFSAETLARGHNTYIKVSRDSKRVMGVDLARFGPDYSVAYICEEGFILGEPDENGARVRTETRGKIVRMEKFWGGKADEYKVDGMESAAIVHTLAMKYGVSEVRIDSEGVGGPIADQVVRLSEGQYAVVMMKGSRTSPDNYRWINARAFWYDKAREEMFNGFIDLDPDDKKLYDELEQIQYHFNNRYRSLQVESKEEMEKRQVKSPDFADAFIYAIADMTDVINDPLSRFRIGDRISMSTEDFLGFAEQSGFISPY